jgi:hypothetical protein
MTLHASLSQVMVNQHKESAVAFLEAAVAYFGQLGIRIERVMTDNASCYRSKLSEQLATISSARSSPAIHPENQWRITLA